MCSTQPQDFQAACSPWPALIFFRHDASRKPKNCSPAPSRFRRTGRIHGRGKHGPCSRQFQGNCRLCRKKDLVILAHANEPVGRQYPGKAPFGLDLYYSMAKAAAGAKLILAHWGGGLFFFELLKKQAPRLLTNLYYDTAASPFVYSHEIFKIATQVAGSRQNSFRQ